MGFDTIAAIATPPGYGGVGIIRIAGPRALELARGLTPGFPTEARSHHLYLRALRSPVDGSLLDRALVVLMRAPRSYTGDDVVELHCHGGGVHLARVLDAVLALGARPAQPGEFTRRAFLNGRLDLVQAEAVADLINAKSEAACRLAQRHLEGSLSAELDRLRERLGRALTLIEAAIDFSLEEHVYDLDRPALKVELGGARDDVDRLLGSYDRGRLARDGIRCVIAGRPNAGKSTLLNRLLGLDRAIVSAVPGTTRDYLDAELVVDGQLFKLVDTAGLRDSADALEVEGVRRSHRQIEDADLILYVADSTQPWACDEADWLATISRGGVFIWSKVDRPGAAAGPSLPAGWLGPVAAHLTAPTSRDQLFEVLRTAAERLGIRVTAESATLSRARHRDALERARESLDQALEAVCLELGHELLALDVRLALDAVGEIVGQLTPDDILGRIFGEFCVGK